VKNSCTLEQDARTGAGGGGVGTGKSAASATPHAPESNEEHVSLFLSVGEG